MMPVPVLAVDNSLVPPPLEAEKGTAALELTKKGLLEPPDRRARRRAPKGALGRHRGGGNGGEKGGCGAVKWHGMRGHRHRVTAQPRGTP